MGMRKKRPDFKELNDQLEMADKMIRFMSKFKTDAGLRSLENLRRRRDRLEAQIYNPESLELCTVCRGAGFIPAHRGMQRCPICGGVGRA